MKVQDVLACSFSQWYPLLKKVTFSSHILPIPNDFLDYLLADNVVLRSNQAVVSYENHSDDSDNESNADKDEWVQAESETPALEAPNFEEFDRQIASIIEKLGGSVFVKLNWSSPKDAAWIALNNSLKCVMPADVHLLLKASDFILHDLTQPFKDCEDKESAPSSVQYELVFRKWIEINPAHEFRCFVKESNIIGVCQRDESQYYPHICEEKNEILHDIVSFFREQIRSKILLQNYVFDVVRIRKDQVKLVDVNPYGITTDSLFFVWGEKPLVFETALNETISSEATLPEFRFHEEDTGVRTNPLRQYGVPQDIAHLTSGEDPYKLIDLLNLQSRQNEEDSD